MNTGKKKVLLKIIILGDSGVGKTCVLHKYVNGIFIEDHKATIGADFLTKELTMDDKLVTLQIWDTAGQERFQSLGTAFYRGADACVIVYDITNKESFDHCNEWKKQFLDQCMPEDADNFPFLCIGNKYDMSGQRAVDAGDGERYAKGSGMLFHETSAMSGHGIEGAMRDISKVASERETAPFFSPDVADKITLEERGQESQPPATGCACSLI